MVNFKGIELLLKISFKCKTCDKVEQFIGVMLDSIGDIYP
jgi:hypothetical protein